MITARRLCSITRCKPSPLEFIYLVLRRWCILAIEFRRLVHSLHAHASSLSQNSRDAGNKVPLRHNQTYNQVAVCREIVKVTRMHVYTLSIE